MKKWRAFPYPNDDYDYPVAKLKSVWPELHRSDQVPWPENEHANTCIAAWQHFHAGRLQQAADTAATVAPYAFAAQCKALIIHADHLEDNESIQQQFYQQATGAAERARDAFPKLAAAHYYHAHALGRYGQSISVVKALRQGLGSKIAESLETALQLSPDYPDAHLAMGLYHAEIIDKVGKLIANMSYGSTREKALHHLELALRLNPRPPVTQIEYGNGVYLLFGEDQLDEANERYRLAAESAPLDAMEMLDKAFARSETETL